MKRVVTMMMLVLTLMTGCATSGSQTENPQPERETVSQPVTQPSESPAPTQEEDTQTMSKASLPADIKQAVLKSVAAEQNVSADQLEITAVKKADWPDACLGLAGPDEMCAQMITSGWALTVTDGQNTWEYRTDLDALQVRLDG